MKLQIITNIRSHNNQSREIRKTEQEIYSDNHKTPITCFSFTNGMYKNKGMQPCKSTIWDICGGTEVHVKINIKKLTLNFIINGGIRVKDRKSTCKFFKIKYPIMLCVKQIKNL